jgi:hypothetical protein
LSVGEFNSDRLKHVNFGNSSIQQAVRLCVLMKALQQAKIYECFPAIFTINDFNEYYDYTAMSFIQASDSGIPN